MTSKVKFIIPACLMVVLLSLSFANVAFADSPIWRETNNIYDQTPTESTSQSLPARPYRIYFYRSDTSLAPGTYSLSYKVNPELNPRSYVGVEIDGSTDYISYNSVPVTFELPENYESLNVFMATAEYVPVSQVTEIMVNEGSPLPYEPPYSGFRFDFAAIAQMIGQYVQPVITMILPYIFLMIALIIGINAGIRVFRKTTS